VIAAAQSIQRMDGAVATIRYGIAVIASKKRYGDLNM
jgi:hypothetical protein